MNEEILEKEAEAFVSEKTDKGNFDLEQFGKAYFSESSMKQALIKFTEQRKVHTEIEINGIRFSNISEMLQYMDKQRERIIELEKENESLLGKLAIRGSKLIKAKELLREIIDTPVFNQMGGELYENEGYTELVEEAEQFLKESE